MVTREKIYELLQHVTDPEVPVLSILDLGIVRDVQTGPNETEITITPTYSGCPAMSRIELDIQTQLLINGITNVKVKTVLTPAWTTDWMSESGKAKLKQYGIAPPTATQSVCSIDLFAADEAIQCPRCNSWNTRRISEFGSTACKSLYQCNDCSEPFDYFKCH